MLPTLTFSDDQAEAYDRVAATLLGMGIDLGDGTLTPFGSNILLKISSMF